ncbi:MAG: cysteine desulfurase family protein, partial [Bradymonadaceae bacterium]
IPGNASSVHQEGQRARAVVERSRRAVAEAVGAEAQGVVLTGGATESNNQVLRSHVRRTDNPRVVCSAVEHPSVLEVVEMLGGRGVDVATCPVDGRGRLDLEALDAELQAGATLVSVMLANNETGTIYPIEEVADRVRAHGARLHVDATQALGRIPIDFESLGADVLTLSFHKTGGPKGIGAIVLREEQTIEALMAGGHQERGRRPGTENVPAAAGLERIAELVAERTPQWRDQMRERRRQFLERLEENCGDFDLRGDPGAHLPNTLNVAFPEIGGEDFLLAADLEGVSASSGSACTAGSLEPSHVVLAMGFDRSDARRSVRFSFGPTTAEDELLEAADRIGRVVRRLSKVGA